MSQETDQSGDLPQDGVEHPVCAYQKTLHMNTCACQSSSYLPCAPKVIYALFWSPRHAVQSETAPALQDLPVARHLFDTQTEPDEDQEEDNEDEWQEDASSPDSDPDMPTPVRAWGGCFLCYQHVDKRSPLHPHRGYV